MPYSITPKGKEPEKPLLRRGEVVRWLGINKNMFDQVVARGLLPWKVLYDDGVRLYKTEDVRRVFLENYRVGKG